MRHPIRQTTFLMWFRAILALVLSAWALTYLWKVTFIAEGITLSKYTEFIVGFTLGTTVSTVLGFYFQSRATDSTIRRSTDVILQEPNGNSNGGTNGGLRNGSDTIQRNDSEGKGGVDDEHV